MVNAQRLFPLLATLLIGCGSGPSTDLLCGHCTVDSDCGGNPCFADVTGARFCGAPCAVGCPSNFSCQPVGTTSGTVVKTCFPTSLSCAGFKPGGGAGGSGGLGGGAGGGGTSSDMSVGSGGIDFGNGGIPADISVVPCTTPAGGTVTTSGGTVDRLYFGYTGDTRMASSAQNYTTELQSTINNIYGMMKTNGVEFALDGGDHMEASNASEAASNIGDYLTAVGKLAKPVFMTMGNHECSNSYNMGSDCSTDSAPWSDFKLKAFMGALKTEANQTLPYYRVDVMTQAGKAAFIVVADDVWNATQASWLETQLTDTDANAKFTFVSKHHPVGNSDQTFFADIDKAILKHKYTLFLTGHSHEYKRVYGDRRQIVMGAGGAPHDNPNQQWWGYLTVMQCPNNSFNVSVYDQSTGNVMDQFNVIP